MDFAPNEDQGMLRELVERFAAERYPPALCPAHVVAEAGHDAGNWGLLADLGLHAQPFAEGDGGLGGEAIELMIVGEALGRGMVAEPLLGELFLAGRLLARAGTDEQRAAWLPRIMGGEAHLAVAFAEQRCRYAFDRAETRASGGRLTGDKSFVLAGSACDAFIVSARGSDGTVGLHLVAGDAAGIERRPYRLIDGTPALELRLDGAAAEPLRHGIEALCDVVDEARVPVAAELVGLMGALFDATLDYIKMRRQFGAPIGSFQAIQHRMADLYLLLEQSRSMLFRAALTRGPAGPAARLAAKSYISAAAVRLGEEAIQLHGGMGVTDELIVGHAHKRVLLLASLFGDAATEARRYAALAA